MMLHFTFDTPRPNVSRQEEKNGVTKKICLFWIHIGNDKKGGYVIVSNNILHGKEVRHIYCIYIILMV